MTHKTFAILYIVYTMRICDPLRENPAYPKNIEFLLVAITVTFYRTHYLTKTVTLKVALYLFVHSTLSDV